MSYATLAMQPSAEAQETSSLLEVEAEASEVEEGSLRSLQRVDNMKTRMRMKMTAGGVVAALGATALLAVGAVVTARYRSSAGPLQPAHAVALQQQGKDCVDIDLSCPARAAAGECDWNKKYMNFACRESCQTCPLAQAFIPKTWKINIPKNKDCVYPSDFAKCVIVKVNRDLIECPERLTTGNTIGTKAGDKFVVDVHYDSPTTTAVCVTAHPDPSAGWDSSFSFTCQAKAIYVNIGVGPGYPNCGNKFKVCDTPPVLPTQCPEIVTRDLRRPRDGEPDKFEITIENGQVCATSKDDWRFDVGFFCQAGKLVDPKKSVRVEFGEGNRWRESCTKCIRPKGPVKCPALANEINWATRDEVPEVFSITSRGNGEICATRTDQIGQCDASLGFVEPLMWGTVLGIYCEGEPIQCSCVNPAEYNTFSCNAQVPESSCGDNFQCTIASDIKWSYDHRFRGQNPACKPRTPDVDDVRPRTREEKEERK